MHVALVADMTNVQQQPPCHNAAIMELVYKEHGTLMSQVQAQIENENDNGSVGSSTKVHRHFTHAVVGIETTGMGGSW